MNPTDLIHKFQSTLPAIQKWIDKILAEHRPNAVSVSNLSSPRLSKVFPHDLLARVQVVVVTGKVPFPPLTQMGLTEFTQLENMLKSGITYKDTFFVSHLHQTESLYFHELVHVIQWERLGFYNFLLTYGVGLIQFGYRDCPLERMAYSLQSGFDRGVFPENIINSIQQRTDAIWNAVSSMLPKT
jgi:hypothetical protein